MSLPHPARNASPELYRASIERMCSLTNVELLLTDSLTPEHTPAHGVSVRRFDEILRRPAAGKVADEAGSFVQFTSGSTGQPKGIQLALGAIASNVVSILDALGDGRASSFCSWLPLSHDMGLIGQCLASWIGAGPQFIGETHLCLIAPEAFQANPTIWLRTCSDLRATHSAVPNFGLDIAARLLARTQQIDLSSLRWCGCGAEPVRAQTLRNFASAAGRFGFDGRALSPCYGMAEASLAVTIVRPTEEWHARLVDRDDLARRRWASAEGEGEEVVSVGRPIKDMAVRIAQEPGADVGHIEIFGPSILRGYVGAPSPFTSDGWVRTGDEGALDGDELYVLGRTDDVIVLRGRNLYVPELEVVAAEHASVRTGRCAVIPDGQGRYVVVAERRSGLATEDTLRDAARSMRRALINHCDVGPSSVVFTAAGSLPYTPSGKLQRHRIAQMERDGSLAVTCRVPFGGEG